MSAAGHIRRRAKLGPSKAPFRGSTAKVTTHREARRRTRRGADGLSTVSKAYFSLQISKFLTPDNLSRYAIFFRCSQAVASIISFGPLLAVGNNGPCLGQQKPIECEEQRMNHERESPNSPFSVKVSEAVIETCGPSICAINGEIGGVLYQWGTGTLLRVGERHFLVTAAHVIVDAEKKGAILSIADHVLQNNCPVIPLVQLQVWMVRKEFDLALIELPQAILDKMPNRRCVSTLHFDRNPPTEHDSFYICGYPSEMSNPLHPGGIIQYAINFSTVRIEAPANAPNFDPEVHLMFDPPDGTEIADDGAPMPELLGGISGCPVWRAHSGEPPDKWNSDMIKISAFQTGVCHKQRDEPRTGKLTGIKATTWRVITEILWNQFADLRPALNLFLPSRRK
jgi:hypothetical protein